MEWRIQQPNCHRKSRHFTEDADEVTALQRQQLIERLFAGAHTVRQNHLAHRRQTLIAKKHMLSTTQANSFSPKLSRRLSVEWGISVGPDTQTSERIRPRHQFVEVAFKRRLNCGYLAQKHSTS